MNILHLAYSNASGVPSRWVQAHRDAGLRARLIIEAHDDYDYTYLHGTVRWSNGSYTPREKMLVIEEDLHWADALMVYEHWFYLQVAQLTGKPTLYRALGTAARSEPDVISQHLKWNGIKRATTGTADLAALLHVELAGAPYPLIEPAQPEGTNLAVHAPSHRRSKGTRAIVKAADQTGWTLDIVERSPNREVLKRKRKANLVIDQCGPHAIGYGVNGVEAMAMGLPVITRATTPIRKALAAIGSPAVIVDSPEGLRSMLADLHGNNAPTNLELLGELGRDFVDRFHNPAAQAQRDIEALA